MLHPHCVFMPYQNQNHYSDENETARAILWALRARACETLQYRMFCYRQAVLATR